MKESTLTGSTDFRKVTKYKLGKATKGKQASRTGRTENSNLDSATTRSLSLSSGVPHSWQVLSRKTSLWGQVSPSETLTCVAFMRRSKSFAISTLIVGKCMWLKPLGNNRVP